jgi:hypothetical protein
MFAESFGRSLVIETAASLARDTIDFRWVATATDHGGPRFWAVVDVPAQHHLDRSVDATRALW